jgi:hypothetical protein
MPMADADDLQAIRTLLAGCTPEQKRELFLELRVGQILHPYETAVSAPAEMILEAIHRAPELTRRMLRGVIADAAFAQEVVPVIARLGWTDITGPGNYSYDYQLTDRPGDPAAEITVQIKLQRSERGAPVLKIGARYGFAGGVYFVETQKTRGGTDGADNKTRPYRYGEFDVLAVSMQPSGRGWGSYMYTLGRWLIPGGHPNEIAVMQPVTLARGEFWTPDFAEVAAWFRATDPPGKQMRVLPGRFGRVTADML